MAEKMPPPSIGERGFRRKKVRKNRRIRLPLKCAKAACILRKTCLARRPREAHGRFATAAAGRYSC
jgi:hypothetical protein